MPRGAVVAGVLALAALASCATPPPRTPEKIRFDVTKIDPAGFEGPADGQREVSYQFCIPNRIERRVEILELDPVARFESQAPGRPGCTADEILVHSRTGAPHWRGRLEAVAALPYVKSIRRTPYTSVPKP